MYRVLIGVVLSIVQIQLAQSECANACSGHGQCTSYDMCVCNRNWQANDCSERTCLFGLAHVDTPKGDLDMSGDLSTSPNVENSIVYPYGTTEMFPAMRDSDLQLLPNSAHDYMECSNKGLCDRSSGLCVCYAGYDGAACQRASCPGYPNVCSGNGVCRTKAQLAASDNSNVYKLWDKDVTMGCVCDPGFSGADCSLKTCKHGVDPLYMDDSSVVKYSVFDFATLTTASTDVFHDGTPAQGTGTWAIRFFDSSGEDWVTGAIDAGASCVEVIDALEKLPNNVIPADTITCIRTNKASSVSQLLWTGTDTINGSPNSYPISYQMSIWQADIFKMSIPYTGQNYTDELSPLNIYAAELAYLSSDTSASAQHLSGYIYRLKFKSNPGYLKEPEIVLFLDGSQPTLKTTADHQVISKVWTDGQQGESNDYFANHCDRVNFVINYDSANANGDVYYLNGLTTTERSLLKACLGSADEDTSNNVGVENWDYGNAYFPHFVKLVRTETSYDDSTYYAALIFDSSLTLDDSGDSGTFILLNPFLTPDEVTTNLYEIYTTQGTLALTSDKSQVAVGFGSKHFYITNSSMDFTSVQTFNGDISCYSEPSSTDVPYCLNKGDLFTVLAVAKQAGHSYASENSPHLNLYTATALMTLSAKYLVSDLVTGSDKGTDNLSLGTRILKSDFSSNWAVSLNSPAGGTYHPSRVYKFIPASTSTYNYVNECSNRGICARDTGLCKCFPGYTYDDCSVQSAISL